MAETGEKVTLSSFWNDEEGWAGTAGKVYRPGDSVSFEDANHARLLRDAGLEATDAKSSARASK